MNKEELLYEEWTIHKMISGQKGYYIGPIHGRVSYSAYKTKAAAQAAIWMREWIAEKLKSKKPNL